VEDDNVETALKDQGSFEVLQGPERNPISPIPQDALTEPTPVNDIDFQVLDAETFPQTEIFRADPSAQHSPAISSAPLETVCQQTLDTLRRMRACPELIDALEKRFHDIHSKSDLDLLDSLTKASPRALNLDVIREIEQTLDGYTFENMEVLGIFYASLELVMHDPMLANELRRYYGNHPQMEVKDIANLLEAFYTKLGQDKKTPVFGALLAGERRGKNNLAEIQFLKGMLNPFTELNDLVRSEWWRPILQLFYFPPVELKNLKATKLHPNEAELMMSATVSTYDGRDRSEAHVYNGRFLGSAHPQMQAIIQNIDTPTEQMAQLKEFLSQNPTLSDSDILVLLDNFPKQKGTTDTETFGCHDELFEEGLVNGPYSIKVGTDMVVLWKALKCVGALHHPKEFESALPQMLRVIDESTVRTATTHVVMKELICRTHQNLSERLKHDPKTEPSSKPK